MRIFAGLLGGLFLFLGLVGLAGGTVLVLGTSYDDPTYFCSSTTATNSLPIDCETSGDSVTGYQTYALGAGILGGSLFVGGCALIGGVVAAGRKPAAPAGQAAPTASGPPAYSGSGWQTTQQPPAQPDGPRT